MFNVLSERIHQVLGNLVRNVNVFTHTYIDKNDPRTGILAAAVFAIYSTNKSQKGYSPGQLIFCRDMILPIKHRVDWELIRQQKQMQSNRDNARENRHRVEYDYKVGDNVMLTNHTAYKYETPYKGPFVRTQCFTNGTLNLQYGPIKIRYNIRQIKLYKSDTKVEYFNSINISDYVNI